MVDQPPLGGVSEEVGLTMCHHFSSLLIYDDSLFIYYVYYFLARIIES